jgi:hypothetical protein
MIDYQIEHIEGSQYKTIESAFVASLESKCIAWFKCPKNGRIYRFLNGEPFIIEIVRNKESLID